VGAFSELGDGGWQKGEGLTTAHGQSCLPQPTPVATSLRVEAKFHEWGSDGGDETPIITVCSLSGAKQIEPRGSFSTHNPKTILSKTKIPLQCPPGEFWGLNEPMGRLVEMLPLMVKVVFWSFRGLVVVVVAVELDPEEEGFDEDEVVVVTHSLAPCTPLTFPPPLRSCCEPPAEVPEEPEADGWEETTVEISMLAETKGVCQCAGVGGSFPLI